MRYLWLVFLFVIGPMPLRSDPASIESLITNGLLKPCPEIDKYYPDLHHRMMVDYYVKGFLLNDLEVIDIRRLSVSTKAILVRNHQYYSMYFVERLEKGKYRSVHCYCDTAVLFYPELEESMYVDNAPYWKGPSKASESFDWSN